MLDNFGGASRLLIATLLIGGTALSVSATVSPRNANYRIEATLDADAKTIDGRQTLRWRNIQEAPTSELWFHLYWNGWRNDRSTWMLEDRYRGRSDRGDQIDREDWGYLEVDAVRLAGGPELPGRFESPDDGNPHDRTVFVVELPEAVESGGEVEVELQWRSKIPRTFARTGFRGEFFYIAHWFPKLGVFEGERWNCHQYHAATEFFSDYGVYDVELTLPERFVVGATGLEVERRENADGTVTHHYRQEDVHGFAWTASPDYVEVRDRFERPDLPPVEIRLLMQPEHLHQADRHMHATMATLDLYGRWYGPYPYGHVTVVDPAYRAGAGGMEYPTIFTAGSRWLNPFGGGRPEGVTVHEAGHQFWYGLVGNDEFTAAWLDEGLNTYSTGRVMYETYGASAWVERYFNPPGTSHGGFLPRMLDEVRDPGAISSWRLARYRGDATADVPDRPTWRYDPSSAGNISYSKTAIWLTTLERYLGWERLQGVLSSFFDRWRFGHPTSGDFVAAFEEHAGEPLGWFFDQVLHDDVRFDYAIQSVRSDRVSLEGWTEGDDGTLEYRDGTEGDAETIYRSEVVVRRNGEGRFPVEILFVFEDGREVRRKWDGHYRWTLLAEEGPSKLEYAEVDPDRVLMLDADFANNSRRRSREDRKPAFKWAAKWMIWVQDYLATFASFV